MAKGLASSIIISIISCAVGIAGCYFVGSKSAAKLNADLIDARKSLADASIVNERSSNTIQQLSIGLVKANSVIASQQSTLDKQQSGLVAQQSTIDKQQSTLNNQQHIIDGIAKAVASAGDDIGGRLTALKEGFSLLYKGYH